MEYLGAISELDWNVIDESELMMAQLLGAYEGRDPSAGIEFMFHPDHNASSCDWLHNLASGLHWPIADTATETSLESIDIVSNLLVDPNDRFDMASIKFLDDYSVHPPESIAVAEHTPLPKRKVADSGTDNENDILTENPKKKVQTTAKTRAKKAPKSVGNEAKDESNGSYISEDNSNTSQEPNVGRDGDGTSSNAKGKMRAVRGSATDPQSLYARKRRERINERLKKLQNLVPNGTKVDISTMLEEAVQYVKFLQLQIKLLSSDDLWMYAPLAYNGMDIGLDLQIPSLQQ